MSIVSFDFDGVFHNNVTIGKTNYVTDNRNDIESLQKNINFNILRKVIKESKNNTTIILTSRGIEDKQLIRDFLIDVGINRCIKKIICTDGLPKSPIINKYKISRHYEDSKSYLKEIKENSPTCQLHRVYPNKGGIIKKL